MGFDPARVVQIWSPAAPGHRSSNRPVGEGSGAGSGYRVSEDLVLTAAHVVAGHPEGDPVEGAPTPPVASGSTGVEVAVLGSSTWVPAVVVWRDEVADVAVLHAPRLSGAPAGSPAPRWGVVTGQESVECMAVGFPWAAVTPHQLREAEHLVGFIPPVSGTVTGTQAITVRSSPPLPRNDGGSPWAGMSGAGVFCGRYLVGVIVVDPARYGTDRLRAVPLAPLLESNTELRDLLGARAELEPVRLPPRLAISDQDSMSLRAPYRPLPEEDRVEASAVLLQARYGMVPFSGRTDQLADLESWCQQEGALSLRVVTGDGGAGKTRLAAELCALMTVQGWDTGFADFKRPGGELVHDYDRATLVVVDDAEQQVNRVGQLLESLAYRNAGSVPVRVMLLARNLQVWWEQLNVQTDELAERRASPVMNLKAGKLDSQERIEQYEASHIIWRQFRDPATTAVPEDSDPSSDEPRTEPRSQRSTPAVSGQETGLSLDLNDPAFENPLLVHMTALLQVFPTPSVDQTLASLGDLEDGDARSRDDAVSTKPLRERILRGVLNREKQRWTGVPDRPNFSLMGLQQAVALTTLSAPADKSVLIERLLALPDLADANVGERRKVADWLHQLYPGPEPPWLVPLRPDLLAEELLAGSEELVDIADAVLAQTLQGGDITVIGQVLDELVRASRRGTVREALNHLLEAHLPVILDQALADPTGQIPAVLDRALRVAPQPAQAVEQVERLPERSIILSSLASTLIQQTVDHLRAQAIVDPETFTPDLAGSLNNLSNRLADLGRREEALEAIEESVRLRRGLVSARPGVFTPDLARALTNYSHRLVQLGRREEALEAIEEATRIYRDLVSVRPEAFTPDLALVLNNLSNALADLGRREEALEAIEETTRICRGLVSARPEAFTPDLALALNNLSNALAGLGRREEALEAIEEATRIYRNLAATHPEVFTPDLARALTNRSIHLADLDRREKALEAIEEATKIYRDLTATHPETFTPDLALALTNFSNALAGLGRREEALEAIEESTRIYRDLVSARPEVFTPDLARALNSLLIHLAKLDRREEALEAIEESVKLWQGLVITRPEVFTPNLVSSLTNFSNALADMGRREEALEAIEEATRIYRDLATSRPEVFTPDLAGSLNNLSNRLADLGRGEEALEAIQESVRLRRGLVSARPETFTPDLAPSLNNLSIRLADLGRREEALKAIEETTKIYQDLAAARPEAFTPDLALALNNLSSALAGLGRREGALEAIEESVRLWWGLVSARPEVFTSNLARSLNYFSIRLADLGRREEAFRAIEKSVRIYRTLATTHPDVFIPYLAQGLENMGMCLNKLERPREALDADREALLFYLQLVGEDETFQEEVQNAANNVVIGMRNIGYTDDDILKELESLGIKVS